MNTANGLQYSNWISASSDFRIHVYVCNCYARKALAAFKYSYSIQSNINEEFSVLADYCMRVPVVHTCIH